MTIDLIVVGKTDSKQVDALVETYSKRISFYNRFAITYLPDAKNTKNLTEAQQKRVEGEALLRQIGDGDHLVLLDERGAEFR